MPFILLIARTHTHTHTHIHTHTHTQSICLTYTHTHAFTSPDELKKGGSLVYGADEDDEAKGPGRWEGERDCMFVRE